MPDTLFVSTSTACPAPAPLTISPPPSPGSDAGGWYPFRITPAQWALFFATCYELQLGRSAMVASYGAKEVSLAPPRWNRHPDLPRNWLHATRYPGACNSYGDEIVSGLSCQIGWIGGPEDFAPDGTMPPVCLSGFDYAPLVVGAFTRFTDLSALHVHEGALHPFFLFGFQIVDVSAQVNAAFFTFPFARPLDFYTLAQTDLRLTVFDWGSLPLYRMQATNETPVTLTGDLELHIPFRGTFS